MPLISARRVADDQMPDGGHITMHRITVWDAKDADSAEHGGMTRNPAVLDMVMQLLSSASVAEVQAAEEAPPSPAWYVNVWGSGSAYVTDEVGQVTGVVSDTLHLHDAAEVNYASLGDGSFAMVAPSSGTYTVTFSSDTDPLTISVHRRAGASTDYAALMRDGTLPPNTLLALRLTSDGVESLHYDSNDDGTPDQSIAEQTMVFTGTSAGDVDPPIVQIDVVKQEIGSLVTVHATDTGVGVETIHYSLDGTQFSRYSAPISVPYGVAMHVYALAKDKLGNQTAISRRALPSGPNDLLYGLYLPKLAK